MRSIATDRLRGGVALVTLGLVLMRAATAAVAAPGALDPTFGEGGMVTTNFGWGSTGSDGRAVLQQADGKLVVGGTGWKGYPCFALIRFAQDGSLDTSFGDEGRVLTLLGSPILSGFQDGIRGLVQQSDGKVVATGRVETELGRETALVRYHTDGSLDATFGAGGIVRVTFSGVDEVSALALQDDGRLVVAGYRGFGDGDMLVARFTVDGAIDTGFGDAGSVAVGLAPLGSAEALAIQRDGKLVVAGTHLNGTDHLVVLARYHADGTPDVGFGTGGVVTTNPSNLNDYVSGLLQQADGRLVVVGSMARGIDRDVMVLRYDENGTLDAGFGSGGIVTTSVGNSSSAAAGVVQRPDRKLVVAAEALGAVDWEFVTIQYHEDGSIDSSFGSGGVAAADIGGGGGAPRAVLRQTDGKLVVAGDGGPIGAMALVRFEAGGALDAGFGSGGVATASASSSVDDAAAFAVQSDGRLVAAGTTQTWEFPALALARYDAAGRLDPTFGVGGKVITAVGSGYTEAKGIVQQDGGQLVVAGTVTIGTTTHFALTRYAADGSLDPTFGDGGTIIPMLGPGNGGVNALLQQSDGKLVLAGSSGADAVLLRYRPDGTLDVGFGNAGTVRTSGLGFNALVQQTDGKLVGAGAGGGSTEPLFAVARYNADGTLDQTFSGDGKAIVGSSEVVDAAIFRDVLGQSDGKLVGAGDRVLVRFTAAGSLDTTFAGGVAAGPLRLYAVGQLPDGTLVAGGFRVSENVGQFALTRYDVDGSIDAGFGTAGVALAANGLVDGRVVDLRVLPDAGIVAFGESDSDFVLARFFSQSTTSSTTTSTTSSSSSTTVTTTLVTAPSTSTTLACADTDGDGICDASDPCVNVGGARDATRARVTARNLLPPAGDDALTISGIVTLPTPTLDPLHDGVRVVYGDRAGVIAERFVPPGAYDPVTRTGWTVSGSTHRYVNGDGSLDLVKVTLRARGSTPGQFKVRMKGRDGTYAGAPGNLPAYVVLVLAPPFAATEQCAEWKFPALPPAMPSCVSSTSGDVLTCR